MNTEINIGKLKLKNPILVASGTFGYAKEFEELVDLDKLGGIITKTITLKPREGNKPPRIVETPSGMLNSIGLENHGIENFIREKLPYLEKLKTKIIASIQAEEEDELVEIIKRLNDAGVDAIELNLSCPNVKFGVGSLEFGGNKLIAQDHKATYEFIKKARKSTKRTLIAKLSPNVTDIIEIARAAERAGADGLSLVNTFFGMSIDINTKKPRLGNIYGGLSGPAIRPIALKMVFDVSKNVKIPIIGMGGIMNWQDAVEFIIAGASAVCIGTANFVNPKASLEILDGIKKHMISNKINNIKNLTGSTII